MPLPLLLIAAVWLGGCDAPPPPAPTQSSPTVRLLFDFDDATDQWRVVNDGVMGGLSRGAYTVSEGVLTFSGTLVTRGGGFTSIRTPKRVDLSGFDGVELRVRGSGREFEVEVDDGTRFRRFRSVSRRAPFPTTANWQIVRVPFASLQSSVFGQRVRAPAIDPSQVQSFSLFIADGQDGPFRLDVDWIRAYRDDT
ncbi:MAG: CIA30 family protein [Bacteroidota bacterium]